MGLREGGEQLAMAKWPTLGAFFHSCCHISKVFLFALLLALERVS